MPKWQAMEMTSDMRHHVENHLLHILIWILSIIHFLLTNHNLLLVRHPKSTEIHSILRIVLIQALDRGIETHSILRIALIQVIINVII